MIKKIIILIVLLITIPVYAFNGGMSTPPLDIRESDDSPICYPFRLKVPNTSLACSNITIATLDYAAGIGGAMGSNQIVFEDGAGSLTGDTDFTYIVGTPDAFTANATGSIGQLWTWTGGGIVLNDTFSLQMGTGGTDIGTLTATGGAPGTLGLALGSTMDFFIDTDGNNNTFFVDTSENRIGIATTTPTTKLELIASNEKAYKFTITRTTDMSLAPAAFVFLTDSATTTGTGSPLGVQNYQLTHTGNWANNAITMFGAIATLRGESAQEATGRGISVFSVNTAFANASGKNYDMNKLAMFKSLLGSGGNLDGDLTLDNLYMIQMQVDWSAGIGGTTITGDDWYGIQMDDMNDGTGTHTAVNVLRSHGISVAKQTIATTNYGIVLDGDGTGSDIVFGAGQEHRIFSESSTELAIRPTTKVTIGDGTNETIFAGDGLQTMAGTARVHNTILIHAGVFRTGIGVAPSHGQIGTFDTLDFTGVGGSEDAHTNVHPPEDWEAGTDMTIKIYWAPDDASAGHVQWEVNYEALAPEANEVLGTGSTNIELHDDTQSLQHEVLSTAEGTMTGLADEDIIGIEIIRLIDAGDTYDSQDALLLFVEIEYISNKLGEDFN